MVLLNIPKKEGCLLAKLSCDTELEIRTPFFSEFAISVSSSGLPIASSFLCPFALVPTMMLVFELFPKIQYRYYYYYYYCYYY